MEERKYVYLSYCNGNALPEVTRAQAKKLTHLCIAFAIVEDEVMTAERIRHWLPYVKDLRAYNPDLQVLLSTGGGNQRGHGIATKTPAKLARLVDTCMAIVNEFDLDGIDCDWEFPCDTGDMDEKFQYTALMRAYRDALDAREQKTGRKMWLTAAWSAAEWTFSAIELDKLLPIMDFINIMSYDMNEYAPDGGNTSTGHHSNVYPSTGDPQPLCCQTSLEIYNRNGVPNDKIVMGAAFYSKQWNGVPEGGTHGLHQKAKSRCVHGPGYDVIREAYEVNPDYIKYWDDEAKACWLYNGYNFITYEDPRAMIEKVEFVKEKQLRGIMYWEHHYDSTSTLFNIIYDNLYL